MARILLTFLLFCILPSHAESSRLLEAFVGMPIQLDAEIETPAIFSNSNTLSVPKVGEIITIQIFVPQSAGKKSLGYDITFAIAGKNIGDYLQRPTGTTWEGTTLNQSQGFHSVTSLLLSQPTYPSSGFWGTVSFQVVASLSEGDALIVSEAFVGDVNTDRDALDITGASIIFTDRVEAIGGDIDLDGDVDFVDFLTFAGNFGKKGPVPSEAIRVNTVVIRDTVNIEVVRVDTIFASQTITDTVEVVKTIRDTVFTNSNGELATINLQARADIQSGSGDQLYGQNLSITSGNEPVTIEVFATGFDKMVGFEALFEVDDPDKISNVSGKVRDEFFVLAARKEENKIRLTGGVIPSFTERSGGFQFMGSLNLTVSGTVQIAFKTYETGRTDGYSITYSPNVDLKISIGATATPNDAALERANKLLGFWGFGYTLGSSHYVDQFHIQQISSDRTDDGEFFVEGVSNLGVPVFGTFFPSFQKYVIFEQGVFLSSWYEFEIVGNKAVGEVAIWFTDSETIADASVHTFDSSSGRITGFSSSKLAGESDKASELRALEPRRPPGQRNISAEMLRAFSEIQKKQK